MNFTDIKIDSKKKPQLSKNAELVLQKRYLAKDEKGKPTETPQGLFERVAKYVALADETYGKSEVELGKIATDFYDLMADGAFLPNSPTLMNAGRPLGQLSACFVLPVEDSMDGIFDSLKSMALIHKSGGGTGFSFSSLRPKNDIVKSTAGVSSGPVSFMNIFNAATETVKQGGTRRGANMAILRVDHPDIIEFITAKEDLTVLTNFNISVALTDAFMKAVDADEEYDLVNSRTGEKAGKLNAREVFDLIVEKAWNTGEPGIVFIDHINDKNPLKKVGLIESTNPCGEQPLLPFESCNLGSINLNAVVVKKGKKVSVDYDLLREITSRAVHFLDNVIDMNRYPLDAIKDQTLANRKIGLGVMGFADLLAHLGVAYCSDDAVELSYKIMSTIQDESKKASIVLGEERGSFPNFDKSDFAEEGMKALRNATTTTIAPTGTISILAGCSSGIEPIFALAYVRNVMDNNKLIETNPLFEETARAAGIYSKELMEKIAEHGTVQDVEEVPEEMKRSFVTAHDVSPMWHVRIQAAFQEHVDNAVSKTVNFSNSATVEDIREVYTKAYETGCKGVTVYRDGSRDGQVLSAGTSTDKKDDEAGTAVIHCNAEPRARHDITWGSTRKMQTGCGALYVTINEDENGLFEVFATMGKSGGCAASQTEAVSRLISLSLRSGIGKEQIIKQLKGVRCPNQAWEKGGRVYSCADAVAKALERHTGVVTANPNDHDEEKNLAETNGKGSGSVMVGVCPDCHGPLEFESGCSVCRSCGFSRCG